MSRDFMAVCAYERDRLQNKIHASEKVLGLYRQLWKTYGELAQADDTAAASWKAAQNFIAETVSPIIKREIATYRESLELVTLAQERGFLEIGSANVH